MPAFWSRIITSELQAYGFLALLLAFFLLLKTLYRLFLSPLSKFPGPKFAASTKLYESYHAVMKNDWLSNLKSLHDVYGPVVRIGPNELHFSDHEECLRHHNRTDLRKCENYYGILDKVLGGMTLPQLHSERKSIVQPLFSSAKLASYSHTTMNRHLDQLYERLVSSSALKDSPTNLTHILWAFTNDSMFSYVMDEDVGFLKSPDLVATHDSTRTVGSIELATLLRSMPMVKKLSDLFPFTRQLSPLGWIDSRVGMQFDRIMNEDSPRSSEKSQSSILGRLWCQLGDKQTAIQECSQAVFIGNESLLSNLTYLLHYMIKSPECIAKIRAEICQCLDVGSYGHQIWRDPNVLQLPYLDAVCRESTRLSAPGWHRQPRQVDEPVTYNETVIPPMTSLSFTLYLLGRDPVLYPNPEAFKPERWLGQGPEARKLRNNSVTFGAGTRTCLGQMLARQILRKTLVSIVHNFDISIWDEEGDKREGYKYLATYPKKGHVGYLRVKLTPRLGDA
ncbi:hypothetical protein M426DRAFT_14643 [Hypoxylon sp. CI-4A]|nr:hypothetical protein M426DRAFT_14643 [Hypoxylon sp. CI-4A]